MKTFLTILFLNFSLFSSAEVIVEIDTIPNWQVYNGSKLLKAFHSFSQNNRIILWKGNIRTIDTLKVRYSDDTSCFECNAILTIRTEKEVTLRRIEDSKIHSEFAIKTTDLQVLAFDNKSSILRFYFKEDEADKEMLLFEILIR